MESKSKYPAQQLMQVLLQDGGVEARPVGELSSVLGPTADRHWQGMA